MNPSGDHAGDTSLDGNGIKRKNINGGKEGRYEEGVEKMSGSEEQSNQAEVIGEGIRRDDGRRGGVEQRPLPRPRIEVQRCCYMNRNVPLVLVERRNTRNQAGTRG